MNIYLSTKYCFIHFYPGFTFAGLWSVYTKYLCEGIPSEYLGTLQGFLHGVYWGLGNGTGHMLGGLSIENLGARITFWIFAVASFVNLIVFLVIQKVNMPLTYILSMLSIKIRFVLNTYFAVLFHYDLKHTHSNVFAFLMRVCLLIYNKNMHFHTYFV